VETAEAKTVLALIRVVGMIGRLVPMKASVPLALWIARHVGTAELKHVTVLKAADGMIGRFA
jgi:hypothetical protein